MKWKSGSCRMVNKKFIAFIYDGFEAAKIKHMILLMLPGL